MPIVPQSEIRVKVLAVNFKEADEKCGEILVIFFVDLRPLISREIGCKKFDTNSSTHQDLKFHTAEPKFFHSDTLGVGGPNKYLVDASDIFNFFFSARGGGRGKSEAARRRGLVFIENPRRGGGVWEGVCSELGILEDGGGNFFFRGRNVHQE